MTVHEGFQLIWRLKRLDSDYSRFVDLWRMAFMTLLEAQAPLDVLVLSSTLIPPFYERLLRESIALGRLTEEAELVLMMGALAG